MYFYLWGGVQGYNCWRVSIYCLIAAAGRCLTINTYFDEVKQVLRIGIEK